ncbi:MAG: hypothetical protein ACE1ZA_16160 [Pseudomonadales bacterium]
MRPFEFWHPRVFEAPYYLYLLLQCARRGLPIKFLAKANYALDHGELGLGSKYSTQMAFAQNGFLPTLLLDAPQTTSALAKTIDTFAETHGYPIILKPDIGAVGKGIMKLDERPDTSKIVGAIQGAYLLQAFTPLAFEYGVFFIRKKGINQITGINQKHFPTIVGNGRDTIAALAAAHYRFTDHWQMFLKYLDTERVPDEREQVRLSFIGSHTMGCKFTDDTHLATRALEKALYSICDSQPGFNFGRLDVKAESEAAFREGQFVVIEVNGVASLPTHMFDPRNSLRRAYEIFLGHGKHLVDIATEHRDKPMTLKSYPEIWRLAKANQSLLNNMHDKAISA